MRFHQYPCDSPSVRLFCALRYLLVWCVGACATTSVRPRRSPLSPATLPAQTPLSGYQKRCELHRMRRTHHCYGKAIPASRTLFAQPRTANSLHKEIRGREDGRRIRAPQSGAEAWRNAVFEAVRLRIWIFSASALSADILCAKGRRFALFFWVGRTSLRVINLMKPRRSTPPTPSVLPPSLLPSSIPLYVLPPSPPSPSLSPSSIHP